MAVEPQRGQVRVRSADGPVWGAAVLVAPGNTGVHALTCAHVVAAAEQDPGRRRLMVDLPARAWHAEVDPVPAAWSPPPPLDGLEAPEGDAADFAVLPLRADHMPLPRSCGPLRPAACGTPDGRRVSVVGYPRGAPAGIIATAVLTGKAGPCPDWVQLDGLHTTGAVVERGFSGAAVWDPVRQAVVGLVTAAHTDRSTKVAWMLPMETAARHWPPLAGALRPSGAGAPSRAPSVEDNYRLADRLLDIPQIAYDSGRTLRAALPAPVRRNILDHPFPRQQLAALVAACMDHRRGRTALRTAVRELGGDTTTVRRALADLDVFGGDSPEEA